MNALFCTSARSGLLCLAAAASFTVWSPEPAKAGSAFGCTNLEQDATLPSIEGKEGFFFRILADLRMQHPMTDAMMAEMAALSAALERNGTTLIYLPVPTKSQVMSDMLPDDAHLYGFDTKMAQAVYADMIRRLKQHGIATVDLMTAMRAADAGDPPFYKADFHWTSRGAQLAAESVARVIKAQKGYVDVAPSVFETTEKGNATAYSTMRRVLQRHCRESLPDVETMSYETKQVEAESGSLDIFGDQGSGESIALVGTSYSDSEVPNFSGFLSQFTGLAVSNQSITGGNQFGSITSYLTSKTFAEQRPRFLVWENPIYNNIAQYGLAPLVELITAAEGRCDPVPAAALKAEASSDGLLVDLSKVPLEQASVLFADAGDSGSRKVIIELHRANGEVRTEMIERNARIAASGRFYLPIKPIWAADFSKLVVKFDRVVADQAQIAVCQDQG
jgi:alginate biosynthesis protein AlgX